MYILNFIMPILYRSVKLALGIDKMSQDFYVLHLPMSSELLH